MKLRTALILAVIAPTNSDDVFATKTKAVA